eukprot:jgi/Chrzof1/1036/Cz01g38010.t1
MQVSGGSAGSVVAISLCSGQNADALHQYATDQAKYCRSNRNCYLTLDQSIKDSQQAYLPEDAYAKCTGKGYIQIGTLPLPWIPALKPVQLLDAYTSQSDLINAIAASSYVPAFSSFSVATSFRGQKTVDGTLTGYMECPPGVEYCLRVRVFPRGVRAWNLGIAAAIALKAAKGASSAAAGKAVSIPPATTDPDALAIAASEGVEIAPDIYTALPYSRYEWQELSQIPGDDAALNTLYQLGQQDADAWCQLTGIAEAKKG